MTYRIILSNIRAHEFFSNSRLSSILNISRSIFPRGSLPPLPGRPTCPENYSIALRDACTFDYAPLENHRFRQFCNTAEHFPRGKKNRPSRRALAEQDEENERDEGSPPFEPVVSVERVSTLDVGSASSSPDGGDGLPRKEER